MNKKIIAISLICLAILIVASIIFFAFILPKPILVSPKVLPPSPTPTPTATPSPTPLPTPTYSPTNNSPNENLTIIDGNGGMHGVEGLYNWNLTANIENTGITTAIITNIIIDGQPYASMNPVPIITPSIENGYSLSSNQTLTITIFDNNSQTQPFHNGGKIYLVTAIGNSYLLYQSTG
jgi:hypothetical protein